jgi:chromate transporter
MIEKPKKLRTFIEIFGVSTRLGLTSFGGPIAHLGYFHAEYIRKRKWMDEQTYGDLVALCQFLPGPASSQVGISIGIYRGGLLGGLAAWLGFTLPSALAMALFALMLQGSPIGNMGWIHGLKIMAVAIVAQAVWGMGKSLAPDKPRATIAIVSAVFSLLWPTAIGQILLIAAAGMIGTLIFRNMEHKHHTPMRSPVSKKVGIVAWMILIALLLGLPLLRSLCPNIWISMFDSFFRTGSLVFGGGHVVLPLLEREVLLSGWVTKEEFLAGYGAAQAVPGPLFTFAAYLGAVAKGWLGAITAIFAIFLPAFLLVVGCLPFWDEIRQRPIFQSTLYGINASVVGILLAALYDPIWTTAIHSEQDFVLTLLCFMLLVYWRIAPWLVVLFAAVGGWLISA